MFARCLHTWFTWDFYPAGIQSPNPNVGACTKSQVGVVEELPVLLEAVENIVSEDKPVQVKEEVEEKRGEVIAPMIYSTTTNTESIGAKIQLPMVKNEFLHLLTDLFIDEYFTINLYS